jgi:hypothetical protein
MRRTKRMAAAWWSACASLALAQDLLQPTFRTPLTPGGNIAPPPVGAPRSRDGGPG